MNTTETILYGGYGANRDPEMLKAITGNPNLLGRAATFKDVELCVQRFDQIPDALASTAPVPKSPKEIMVGSWGENSDFETYTIRPSEGNAVSGNVFELTSLERALIAEWEMIEFGWYKRMNIIAMLEDGTEITVETEGLGDDQLVDRVIDGIDYPNYLNDSIGMYTMADKVRAEYLALGN
jgi:hypothetical protein